MQPLKRARGHVETAQDFPDRDEAAGPRQRTPSSDSSNGVPEVLRSLGWELTFSFNRVHVTSVPKIREEDY